MNDPVWSKKSCGLVWRLATSILKLKRELHDPGIGHRTGDGPERSGSKGGRRVRKRSVVPVIEKFSQKAQAQRDMMKIPLAKLFAPRLLK